MTQAGLLPWLLSAGIPGLCVHTYLVLAFTSHLHRWNIALCRYLVYISVLWSDLKLSSDGQADLTHLSQSTQFPAHLQILHLGIGPEASPASSQPHFFMTLSMGWKMPCSHSLQNFCFRESRLCRWRKPDNCETLASALSGQGCSLGNIETAKSGYAWSCFTWTHKQSRLPWCTVSGDAVPGCVRSLQCFPHLHLHVSKDLHFLHERSACLQFHHHQEERERKKKHFQKKKMTAIRVTSRKYDIDIWYLKYQKLAARGTLVTAQLPPPLPILHSGNSSFEFGLKVNSFTDPSSLSY